MDPRAASSAASPPSRPLLLAGCGYVGSRLAARLAGQRGLIALLRDGPRGDMLEARGVTVLRLDLDGDMPAGSLVRASGADICYLAPPPDSGGSDPRLERFLGALDAIGRPDCFLYMSTTGVYGDHGGARVDEASATAAASARGRRRLAAERCLQAWCSQGHGRCLVLRVPGIYGPDRLPIERLRRGEPALRAEDAPPGNRIHVDDLVEACVAALHGTKQGTFNVCDGDHRSTSAFMQEVARQADLPPPPLVSLEEARERISPGMLSFLTESRVVDNTRLLSELRLDLRHPRFESGIRESLAEMHAARAQTAV